MQNLTTINASSPHLPPLELSCLSLHIQLWNCKNKANDVKHDSHSDIFSLEQNSSLVQTIYALLKEVLLNPQKSVNYFTLANHLSSSHILMVTDSVETHLCSYIFFMHLPILRKNQLTREFIFMQGWELFPCPSKLKKFVESLYYEPDASCIVSLLEKIHVSQIERSYKLHGYAKIINSIFSYEKLGGKGLHHFPPCLAQNFIQVFPQSLVSILSYLQPHEKLPSLKITVEKLSRKVFKKMALLGKDYLAWTITCIPFFPSKWVQEKIFLLPQSSHSPLNSKEILLQIAQLYEEKHPSDGLGFVYTLLGTTLCRKETIFIQNKPYKSYELHLKTVMKIQAFITRNEPETKFFSEEFPLRQKISQLLVKKAAATAYSGLASCLKQQAAVSIGEEQISKTDLLLKAFTFDPLCPFIYYHAAKAFQEPIQLGSTLYSSSKELYKKAIFLGPNQAIFYSSLAHLVSSNEQVILQDQSCWIKQKLYERAIALKDPSPITYYQYALFLNDSEENRKHPQKLSYQKIDLFIQSFLLEPDRKRQYFYLHAFVWELKKIHLRQLPTVSFAQPN